MKFKSLLALVPVFGLFRTGDILAGEGNPAAVRRQLDRWVKSGKIIQLRREVYQLAPPYLQSPPHPFLIANFLRRSSYVSLQSALSYYGMIPEHVPVVTSVTGDRSEEVKTPGGRFIFRHVQKRLFFGLMEKELAPEQRVVIATPQKALADLLYLTPGSDHSGYLEELRLEFPGDFDWKGLENVAIQISLPKLERAVKRLKTIWEERTAYETPVD